ncbi:hypothetical protein AGMMS50233_07840 [Endomicrobiia bacterium]|nr:hypothetical protein AGMMS50233_07840 [Endomicrobiia bacterium]
MKKIIHTFFFLLFIGNIFGQEIVYTIPAESAVSPSGAATYNIPIEVPVGTNGVQPNISIVYNSQSGMGNLGLGWDICGVSTITRGIKSIYYDDSVFNNFISFTNEDQLYLDGQRLILLSGTHFQVGAIYGFEVENYSRITIKSFENHIYFELKTLDGQIIEYGKGNSRLTNAASYGTNTREFAWKISKTNDVFENEINYLYTERGQYLKKITYCNNEIDFTYQKNNVNPQKRYINTFLLAQDSVLSRIAVKVTNTLIKTYTFNYNSTHNICRLTDIKSYAGTISSQNLLGTTSIEWEQDNSTIQNIVVTPMWDGHITTVNNGYLYTGDIDGDGYRDLIQVWTGSQATDEQGYIKIYLHDRQLPIVNFGAINQTFPNFVTKLVVGDVENDGKDEIILITSDAITSDIKISTFGLSSSGTSLSLKSVALIDTNVFVNHLSNYTDYTALLTSLNGDEYQDLLIIPYWKRNANLTASDSKMIFHKGKSGGIFNSAEYVNINMADNQGVWGNKALVGDFDADGKFDILHILANNISSSHSVYSNYFNIFESKQWNSWTEDGLFWYKNNNSNKPRARFDVLYPIDVNVDGRTDLLVHQPAGYDYDWFILKSNGLDASPTRQEIDLPHVHSHKDYLNYDLQYPIFLDYNGDDYVDIVIADEVYLHTNCNGFCRTDWIFYKNNNGTFQYDTTIVSTTELSKMQPVVIDINNDGVQDLVYADGTNYRAFTMPNVGKRNLVKKITNNLGQSEEFTYKNNASYEKPVAGNVRTMNAPLMLVDRHKQINGETIEYQFNKAKMHKTKGFLGFEKIVAKNLTTGNKTESNYAVVNANQYFNFALISQKDSIGNQLVATTNFYNRDIIKTSKRYISVVDSIVSVDVLKDIRKKKINIYDTWGRLTSDTLLEGDYKTITSYSNFIAKNQSVIAYLPQNKTIKYQKGSEIKEYLTNLTYNDKGQIASQTDFANKSENIVTTYEYYPSGNLKKVLKNVAGLPKDSVRYEYDSRFRYELKRINTFGQFSQRNIDTIKGLLLSEAGIDGLTTSYTYNKAGQIISKTEPNGVITNYLYNKDTAHGALYKVTETIPSINSQIISYYDSVGREVYKTQTGANANLLHSSKQYNAKNQLTKEILPHETNDTTVAYKQYNYDNFHRVNTITKFDGVFTNRIHYIYASKLIATMDMIDYQQISSTNFDNAGLVASKTDRGGTITYSYNAEKQPVKIIVGGIETQRITYDQYGYQDSLIDAHAGKIAYQNYPDGKVKQKISPKNNRTVYQYDALGRIITERTLDLDSAHTYAYSYIAGGNGIGQLASETYYVRQISRGSDGGIQIGTDLHITIDMHASLDKIIHKKCYTYNSNHLLLSDTNIYENVKYVHSYTYDSLWRLKTQKSPSSVTTTYIYDNYGNISQIKVNNSAVWTQNEISAKGKIKQFTLGNGLVENRTYLNNSLISSQTVNNSTVALFSQFYNYDRHYNLTLRNNPRYGRKETFTYDNLDRLVSIHDSANAEVYPITYASNGNITNKYDAGQYVYSTSPRPYRLMDVYETDTNYNNGVGSKFEYLDYNYFNKATLIELGGGKYSLYYGVDKQRIKSIDSIPQRKTVRYYFGSYEKEIINDTATHIDYIFAPSGLALIVKTHIATAAVGKGAGGIGDGTATTQPGIPSGYDFYYVSTDNLGSIVMITNTSKTVISKYYYQPFGGRVLLAGTDITPRGYTFHEHLATFGLINMNGRFYDPVLARFLSPDPYVQMPNFTQNYNRYAYALNNPFKFRDPSGEFIITFIVNAIIGWVKGDDFEEGLQKGGNAFVNHFKIFGGLFTTDKTKNFWGQAWELVSRFTWQGIQTVVGHIYTQVSNLSGQIDKVDYKGGATVSSGNFWGQRGAAITMGSYINGSRELTANADNSLFQHEYGHYLQSQSVGPIYFALYGIPSLISASKKPPHNHDYFRTEQNANERSLAYYTQKTKSFGLDDGSWDYKLNPVVGFPSNMPYWTNQEYINLYFRKKNNLFFNVLRVNF